MEVQFDEEAFRKPAKKINNFDSLVRCTRSFAAPARSLHPLIRYFDASQLINKNRSCALTME